MAENRICKLLGIRYPIIQAPMNWVSGAALTAAVSEAGGLGALGPNSGADAIVEDVDLTGERMREQIRKVRRLTGAPFAVNVVVGFGEEMKYSEKIVQVIIEEKVPAAIVSVGRPDVYTERLHAAGTRVLHAISTARHARKAQDAGVDAVILEGFEAGGHKGFTELTTLVLTPLVADAVTIPVVAGGGIGDARGILAALALGADGVYMGSRFMATRESESHPNVKEAIVRGEDACTVSVPKGFMLARDLKNRFTEEFGAIQKSGEPIEAMGAYLNEHSQYHSQHLGRADDAEICCGQVAGLIKDIPAAGDIVAGIVTDLRTRFEELGRRLKELGL